MLADCATQYRRVDQSPQSHGSHDGDDQDGPVRAGSRRAREVRAFSSLLRCRFRAMSATELSGIARSAPFLVLSRWILWASRFVSSQPKVNCSERRIPV